MILAGLVLCGSILRADVIAGNFGTDFAYTVEDGVNVASEGTETSIGIEFSPLTNNYDLTSIEVVATSTDPESTNPESLNDGPSVIMSIFADNGGVPGATPIEVLTYTGQLSPLVPVDDDPQASPITLTSSDNPELFAGTNYWLVMDGPASESLLWDLNSIFTSGYIAGNSTTDVWGTPTRETNGVFEIDGDVVSGGGSSTPEPQTWWLMAGGFAAVGCFARRKSTAN